MARMWPERQEGTWVDCKTDGTKLSRLVMSFCAWIVGLITPASVERYLSYRPQVDFYQNGIKTTPTTGTTADYFSKTQTGREQRVTALK